MQARGGLRTLAIARRHVLWRQQEGKEGKKKETVAVLIPVNCQLSLGFQVRVYGLGFRYHWGVLIPVNSQLNKYSSRLQVEPTVFFELSDFVHELLGSV